MDNTLALPTAEEAKKIETALSEIFVEVAKIDERIAKDQQETERLRTETRKILTELKAR